MTTSKKTLDEYLEEFAGIAEDWFRENTHARKYYEFFQEFFQEQRLKTAEWEDFQQIGEHIHAYGSLALAKKKAFGRPNYDMETYRESFQYLAHGPGTVEERMRAFATGTGYASKYIGAGALSEIVGQLNADEYIFHNGRDKTAANFLDIEPEFEPGDDTAAKFVKFSRAMQPVFEAFRRIVRAPSDLPLGIQVDQFFNWLHQTHIKPRADDPKQKVWLMSAGRKAKYWPMFKKDGIIALGMAAIGDLNQFSSSNEIMEHLMENLSHDRRPTNDAKAGWQFANVMEPGDLVFIKHGRRVILGCGEVTGEYFFDTSRAEYRNTRKVRWTHDDRWELPDISLPVKTLTNITKRKQKVAVIKEALGIGVGPVQQYWWLNCNPSIWQVADKPNGYRKSYTTHSETGNKRQKYRYFGLLEPGDEVLGYQTTPDRKVTTLLKVTRAVHELEDDELVEFEVVKQFPKPPTWDDLKEREDLADCEPMKNNQGSLFSVTEDEFQAIKKLAEKGTEPTEELPPFNVDDAMEGLFMARPAFESMLERLEAKKNLILQGPPGVGKTFVVRRLAFALMQEMAPKRIQMVQFHQSFSYEDFVQGYRPTTSGGFALRDAVFYRFCERARQDSTVKYVFIIDEINRGNLSKIFGELLMLIEGDKRIAQYATLLTYQSPEDKPFFVPENVYIIGMMNTADRSLAMVDYALRRRFSFIDIEPAFNRSVFHGYLSARTTTDGLDKHIVNRFDALNRVIADDTSSLGPGFRIGHSYFCEDSDEGIDVDGYHQIIDTEIAPLLREYWFDRPEEAKKRIDELRMHTPG